MVWFKNIPIKNKKLNLEVELFKMVG